MIPANPFGCLTVTTLCSKIPDHPEKLLANKFCILKLEYDDKYVNIKKYNMQYVKRRGRLHPPAAPQLYI